MKKWYLLLCTAAFVLSAHSQSFSLNDLVSYTAYNSSRFENSIAKRGYRTAGFNTTVEGRAYTWHEKKAKEAKEENEEPVEKSIFKCDKEDKATIAFQTTALNEFIVLSQQLKKEGYHYTEGAKKELYQKDNITIAPMKKEEDGKTVYSFSIERKALPRAKDIVHAEDFLQLTSHEYLSAVFGESAVKPDQFYFSESEVNRCSVLYPNTSMQVIFIWKDEDNLRDPAFILIGGQLLTKSALLANKQIEQNRWQSQQGIYSGMSLNELQRLNGKSINIWGWQSEQPGVVAEKNSGSIDFKNLHLVLNCLDCNEETSRKKNEMLNSDAVLREGRRVYVSTIIVLPVKK